MIFSNNMVSDVVSHVKYCKNITAVNRQMEDTSCLCHREGVELTQICVLVHFYVGVGLTARHRGV